MNESIETRLQFHGRFAGESNEQQALRKRNERSEAADHIAQLTAELEAARKDAARYRKIKADNASPEIETFCLFYDTENQNLEPVEDMDAAIDAKLAPAPQKG